MKIKFILLGVFGGILLLSGFVAHAIKTIPLDMQKEATVVSVEKPKIVSRQFPYYPTGAKTANVELCVPLHDLLMKTDQSKLNVSMNFLKAIAIWIMPTDGDFAGLLDLSEYTK